MTTLAGVVVVGQYRAREQARSSKTVNIQDLVGKSAWTRPSVARSLPGDYERAAWAWSLSTGSTTGLAALGVSTASYVVATSLLFVSIGMVGPVRFAVIDNTAPVWAALLRMALLLWLKQFRLDHRRARLAFEAGEWSREFPFGTYLHERRYGVNCSSVGPPTAEFL